MTNTKKAILVVLIMACIVAAYFTLKKDEPITDSLKNVLDKTKGADTNTLPIQGNPNKLIKYNSKGTEVTYLQAYLNKEHNTGLVVDGIFGDKTYTALNTNKYPFPISISQLT